MFEVTAQCQRAADAATYLALATTEQKNSALDAMADALILHQKNILSANAQDIATAKAGNMSAALIDRLTLTPKRIADMAEGLHQVARLPDPIGEVIDVWTRPNGLQIRKVRVPLGAIGIIYEARPNVTADAAGLCLKSGNACVLRGSSNTLTTNSLIADTLRVALLKSGLPKDAVQLVASADRAAVDEMLRQRGTLAVVIPRGGAELIARVVQQSQVPTIETGVGNCHVYVDAAADLRKAEEIVLNAKVQRCSVCNAAETLLVHRNVAEKFLPEMFERLHAAGVTIHGDEIVCRLDARAIPATAADWDTEYLALDLAVKVVESLDDAIAHIAQHGTKHTEAIITEDSSAAQRFAAKVDAAAVMINASTRFTDGYEFGFGAEIGISTQKIHARGPMGLRELTTSKYIVTGNGQIRP